MPHPSDHDAWFKSKVYEALTDKRPDVTHEELVQRCRENLLKTIPIHTPKEYED